MITWASGRTGARTYSPLDAPGTIAALVGELAREAVPGQPPPTPQGGFLRP